MSDFYIMEKEGVRIPLGDFPFRKFLAQNAIPFNKCEASHHKHYKYGYGWRGHNHGSAPWWICFFEEPPIEIQIEAFNETVKNHKVPAWLDNPLLCAIRVAQAREKQQNQKGQNMQNENQLKQKAVLMRLSIGCPGTQRADRATSDEVKATKHLGLNSGKWVKELYPPDALKAIRQLDGEASRYHGAVTLPFDTGCGILPAALIVEYGAKMRDLRGRREVMVAEFIDKYPSFIEWAKVEHNGTFDETLYDIEKARGSFHFKWEPIPVPDACHFEATVTSLLGVDAQSVTERIRDAAVEAQKELLKRMIEPVAHMVRTLAKDSPKIFDTLTGNIAEIAALVPKLNIAGDTSLDEFAAEMADLSKYTREDLKKDMFKSEARKKAEAVLSKLNGYQL